MSCQRKSLKYPCWGIFQIPSPSAAFPKTVLHCSWEPSDSGPFKYGLRWFWTALSFEMPSFYWAEIGITLPPGGWPSLSEGFQIGQGSRLQVESTPYLGYSAWGAEGLSCLCPAPPSCLEAGTCAYFRARFLAQQKATLQALFSLLGYAHLEVSIFTLALISHNEKVLRLPDTAEHAETNHQRGHFSTQSKLEQSCPVTNHSIVMHEAGGSSLVGKTVSFSHGPRSHHRNLSALNYPSGPFLHVW